MKIAVFTEMIDYLKKDNALAKGKISRDYPNMRNDMAWMHKFDADHYPIHMMHRLRGEWKYDLGIVTIPKTDIENLSKYPLIESMKKICKKIGFMQEGPHWYFQDYTMEQQIWFYNILMEMDFIWCHNKSDRKYYEGLTGKKCYINPTMMITDLIEPKVKPEDRKDVIIGGNMVRWYGGFDSYIIAQEFGEDIFAPSMGRKIEREDEMDINHLPYMDWLNWMNNLSRFKYAVHLMPTVAAGTFTLNCAYYGIPCIGYKGLDTQELHPSLSVEFGDLKSARVLAKKLKTDDDFYKKCSNECRLNYQKSNFREENFNNIMKDISENL